MVSYKVFKTRDTGKDSVYLEEGPDVIRIVFPRGNRNTAEAVKW